MGAEMRLAADKKGKAKSSEDKAKDKIVQRYATGRLFYPVVLTHPTAN